MTRFGMVLAAGFGTRFRPITYVRPKPLIPLCNRPLVGWAIDALVAAGASEIIVNTHHLPELLEAWLTTHYASQVQLHFSREEEILGTGGGIRRVRSLLDKEEDFFLVNGDTVQLPPWAELQSARASRDALAALTLRHPPEGDRFTAVWMEDGRVTGFGRGTGEPLMFSGSHLISSRIFSYLPDKEFSGIVDEVYQPQIDGGKEKIAAVVDDGLWFDIGNSQRYLKASFAVLNAMAEGAIAVERDSVLRNGLLLHRSAAVDGDVRETIVGARSSVAGSAIGSIVWEDASIGPGCRLERCIVSEGVTMDGSVEFRDVMICRDDPRIPAEYERRHGVVVAPI